MDNKINFRDKLVHVVGVSGMEGWAATKFLISKGAKVVGHDFAKEEKVKENFLNFRDYLSQEQKKEHWQEFKSLRLDINYRSSYLNNIDQAEFIFLPQSWFRYDFNESLENFKDKGKFFGILDLYVNFCPATIVGVTGSNGKSTVSRMIHSILSTEKKALLSGNDRENLPVLDKIENLSKKDYLVLEISNRQLIGFDYSIDIGLITNIFPTHIDDHGSFENYKQVKGNLIANQTSDQQAIINCDDNNSQYLQELGQGEKYLFSRKTKVDRGCYLKNKQAYYCNDKEREKIFEVSKLKVPGFHNRENALAAACLGKIAGISNDNIRDSLYSFTGAKHRLEFVGKVDGVSYFNDSQSTNPGSTVAGLNSFDQTVILIVGGKDKPNPDDFDILAKEVAENKNLKAVFLIGQSADQIKKSFAKFNVSKSIFITCSSFTDAFDKARFMAEAGDIVLLSPACESFGEFKDYRQRGNGFRKLVKSLSKDD